MSSFTQNVVSVRPAARHEALLVSRLLQLCLHDLSEWTAAKVAADGCFVYPWLDSYWESPRRHPYLIRHAGETAGFALVREKDHDEVAEWDFQLAEFFILRGVRKRGLGAAAARLVLSRHAGLFDISYHASNAAARAFWKQVVAEYDSSLVPSPMNGRERYFLSTERTTQAIALACPNDRQIPELRSSYEMLGGLVFFGRTLDKIRVHAQGRLPSDYNRGHGLDGRVCRFLGVDYDALVAKTLGEKDDLKVLEWCYAVGRRPSDEEVFIFNAFMTKRGIRDDVSDWVKEQKEKMELSHRDDIQSAFDIHDADEGRK